MIIACPACTTRYVVPDSALGVEGRTVRCAKCRHSWHQEGPELDLGKFEDSGTEDAATAEQPAVPAPEPAQEPEEPSLPASDPLPTPGFSNTHLHDDTEGIEQSSNQDAVPVDTPPPPQMPNIAQSEREHVTASDYDDDVSQFDYRPPFRPRRNPLKIWTAAGAAFAMLAFGAVWAVSYYGIPDWVPISRPTFGVGQPDLVLDFPADQQERRSQPDGSEYFGASGTITNTGRETRNVPSILIVMRNERDAPVYSWELVPPKNTLAPGERITVNEAVANVPKNAKFAEFGWKPS